MSNKPKFIVTKEIVEFIQPKRPDRRSFPPHGDIPVRRALLVDNNKYHPRTARRDKETIKERSRLPITSTFYRPRNGWSDAQ